MWHQQPTFCPGVMTPPFLMPRGVPAGVETAEEAEDDDDEATARKFLPSWETVTRLRAAARWADARRRSCRSTPGSI